MISAFRDGNGVELLNSGAEYFPALRGALDAARAEIFLEAYIFAEDAQAESVIAALAAAARRGVAVRVLIDGFGARDMPTRYRQMLGDAGAQFLVYRPPLWWQPVRGLRRMHRKLVAIDGEIAFVGGINIIDDWNTPHEVPPRFDYAVRLAGPIAADVRDAARALWMITLVAGLRSRGAWPPPGGALPPVAGSMRVRLVIRDNFRHRHDIETAYLDAIAGARESILIASAYFLPSRKVFGALRAAALRGVSVRILLQGPSDHLILKRAAESLYRHLLAAGIQVIEYRKSFLHAKVASVDDAWCTVGSSNLDPFSLFLSREANVVIQDPGFAGALRASLDDAITAGGEEITAVAMTRLPWRVRLAQWLSFRFARALIDWLDLTKGADPGLEGLGARPAEKRRRFRP